MSFGFGVGDFIVVGKTPLIGAITRWHIDIAKLLLQKGVDIETAISKPQIKVAKLCCPGLYNVGGWILWKY